MARALALIFGTVYLMIGLIGFVPAIGGTFGQAPSVLLGYVQTNLLHNIVHAGIGFAGLFAAGSDARAVAFCRWFGVTLIVLGLIGYSRPNPFGVIPIGGLDVWVHVASGLVLALAGFLGARSPIKAA